MRGRVPVLLGLCLALSCSSHREPSCPRRDAPGCPGGPGTDIRFPLTPGNWWVYSVTGGQFSYTRTDSIVGFARFKGEEYSVLERHSTYGTDVKLLRQVGSKLFMFDADDTVSVRGDSIRPALPSLLVDFDESTGGGDLYHVQYPDDCTGPTQEDAGVANLGREEYALGCCLLSKVQGARVDRRVHSVCLAFISTEQTTYNIADELGIVWEHYHRVLDQAGYPSLQEATNDARLVSWHVQSSAQGVGVVDGRVCDH